MERERETTHNVRTKIKSAGTLVVVVHTTSLTRGQRAGPLFLPKPLSGWLKMRTRRFARALSPVVDVDDDDDALVVVLAFRHTTSC